MVIFHSDVRSGYQRVILLSGYLPLYLHTCFGLWINICSSCPLRKAQSLVRQVLAPLASYVALVPASPQPFAAEDNFQHAMSWKDPKFTAWDGKKNTESTRETSAETRQQRVEFGAASPSLCVSISALFFLCAANTCALSHALTKQHLHTSSLDGCFKALHAATRSNPLRFKPRVYAGQRVAQHSHMKPGIKAKT